MLLLALLPLTVASLAGIAWLVHSAHTEAAIHHQLLADRAAAIIDTHTRAANEGVVLLSQLGSTAQEIADIARPTLAGSSPLQAICILDKDHVVRGAALRTGLEEHRAELIGLDFSQFIVSGDEPSLPVDRGIQRSPLTNSAVHILLSPDNSVFALLDPALLQPVLDAELPMGTFCAIVSSDGQVIHGTSPEATRAGELAEAGRFSLRSPVRRSWNGTSYLVAASPSSSTSWNIVVGMEFDLAVAPFTRPVQIAIPIAIGLALLSALGAVFFAYRQARPVSRLAADVRDAHRAGDHQISGDPFTETELIATTVRQMALELRERDQRLQRLAWTIEAAARGAGKLHGQAHMTGVVAELHTATRARCIIAAEWLPGAKPRARVLASRASVALPDDFDYELANHPGRRVADRELLHIRTGVAQQYPDSPLLRLAGADGYIAIPLVLSDGSIGGHIEIIDDHEIILEDDLRNLLLLLATRGSAELQRMHAERHLQQAQSLYATVTLDQEEIVVRWVIDGTITFANEAFCRFAKQERSEIIGRSLYTLLPEEDRERFRDRAIELTSITPTRRFEQQFLDSDHNLHWFDWHHRAIADSKGRVTEYQGTGRAITRLKQLTDDLQRSRNIFAVLAENVDSAFWLTDPSTQKCLYVNPRFLQIWGLADHRMTEIPMAWSVAIHESQRANVVRNYLLHASEGQYSETYQILRADGSTRRVRDRAIPVRTPDGQVTLIVHIATESPAPMPLQPLTV